MSKSRDQINVLRKAYDQTVDNFEAGIEDEDLLPEEFKTSQRYQRLKDALTVDACGSDSLEIFRHLCPKKGMLFLDVGSCANLITKKLHEWPSTYFGIDISPKLIQTIQSFVKHNKITIGGLYVADAAELPFNDNFFDICAIVGVLEYFDIHYIKSALKEVHRVLKPQSKLFIDMPNPSHPDCATMIELEGYLGRTRTNVPTPGEFEVELDKFFSIEKIKRSIMNGYFAKAKK